VFTAPVVLVLQMYKAYSLHAVAAHEPPCSSTNFPGKSTNMSRCLAFLRSRQQVLHFIDSCACSRLLGLQHHALGNLRHLDAAHHLGRQPLCQTRASHHPIQQTRPENGDPGEALHPAQTDWIREKNTGDIGFIDTQPLCVSG